MSFMRRAPEVYGSFVSAHQGHRVAEERIGGAECGTAFGTTTARTYDDRTGKVAGISTTCGSTTLQAVTYEYDEAGRMETRTDGSVTEAFRHDALSRVSHVNNQEHYRYDGLNRGRLEFLRSELGQRNARTSHRGVTGSRRRAPTPTRTTPWPSRNVALAASCHARSALT